MTANVHIKEIVPRANTSLQAVQSHQTDNAALVYGANIPPPPTHSFARIGRHVQRAHLFPQTEQTHPTKHVVIVHGADSLV